MPTQPVRRFHFLREIGSGAFGAVYRARLVQSDGFSRLVAVKLLHARWSDRDEAARRLRDEARLLGRLRHRNIVEVLDLTRIEGRTAVIMELLEAVNLRLVAGAAADIGVPIPTRVACDICSAVASALDAACNRPPAEGEQPLRVVHRDIKPSNVMLTREGVVKVLDFGVARAEFEERESRTQEVAFGSVDFMAPERLFHEPDGPEGDVYSLGATLFELLAGVRFGKARLRQSEQERHVEQRFEELAKRRSFPDKATEDLVHDMLYDMLAFRATDRPAAADAVGRLRGIARRCAAEEGLEMWAEVVVPTLVELSAKAAAGKPAGSLAERVLTEDSFSSRGTPAPAPLPAGPTPSEAPEPPSRLDPPRSRAPVTLDVHSLHVSMPDLPGPAADDDESEAATVVRQVEFDEPEAPRSGPKPTWIAAAAAAAVFALAGMTVVLVGAVGMLWYGLWVETGTVAVDAPVVEDAVAASPSPEVVEPQTEAPPPDLAPPEALGPTFASHMEGTVRVAVRCDGGSASGTDRATVETTSPGDCTVTALGASRERRVAVVHGVRMADYACFQGAGQDCALVPP